MPKILLPGNRWRFRHKSPRNLGLFCILILGSALYDFCEAGASDAPSDLVTIRAAVDFYCRSVKSLEGKCVETMSLDGALDVPQREAFDVLVETSFIADLVQRMTFLESEESYYIIGKNSEHLEFENRRKYTYDGARTYHYMYTHLRSPVETKVEAGALHKLNIQPRDDTRTQRVPWDYAGLRILMAEDENLSACLGKPGVAVDGFEKIDDANCVRVTGSVNEAKAMIKVWFDTGHDFLPRRLEQWRRGTTEGANPILSYRMDVFEFRKFPDETGGGQKWFPVRSRVRLWTNQVYDSEVTELRINPPFDAARFSARIGDLPAGVEVNDFTLGASRHPEYTGGREDLWKERDQMYTEESERIRALLNVARPAPATNPNMEAPVVSASQPGTFHWWAWLLAGLSTVLIISGCVSIVRARRAKSR